MTSGDQLLTRVPGLRAKPRVLPPGGFSVLSTPFRVFFLFCAIAMAAGLVLAPVRMLSNVLLWGNYLTGLGLAGMLFVAVHDSSSAGWAIVLRRVPVAFANLVPIGSILVLVSILGGGSQLYPWMNDGHLEGFKGVWLSVPFFHIRAVVYLAAWYAFSRAFADADAREPEDVHRERGRSAMFIVVFAFTVWLSSVDWIMSLEPYWYSTVFGVYRFAGLFCAGIAAITMTVVLLRRSGAFGDAINDHHLHDLGKLMFAFSTFWMYIWFSQYMLIWYGNIAEEATYFAFRGADAWGNLMILNLILNWGIPFLVLLSSRAKWNEKVLIRVSGLLLVGHWLDLFIAIFPPTSPDVPRIGGLEIAAASLGVMVVLIVVSAALGRRPLVPGFHPLFEESLKHHGGVRLG